MQSSEQQSLYFNSQPKKNVLQNKPLYQQSNKSVSKQSSLASNKSTSIIKFIKRKPYTQILEGVEVTYSIVSKKQQNFILTHERLLVLIGIQTIGYVRELPQSQILPFEDLQRMPTPKSSYKLSEITRATISNDKNLIINFRSQNKKATWEFICPSQVCAFQWNRKITKALQLWEQFTKSNYQSTRQFMSSKNTKEGKGMQKNLVTFLKQQNATKLSTIKEQNSPRNNQINDNQQYAFDINSQKVSPFQKNAENKNAYYNNYWDSKNSNKAESYSFNVNNLSNEAKKPYYQPNSPQIPSINNFVHQTYPSQKNLGQSYNNLSFQEKVEKQSPNKMDNKKDLNRDKTAKRFAKQQKQKFFQQINKMRRNWTEQILGQGSYIELIIDFKRYVEKIAQFIINELSVAQQQRILPAYQQKSESSLYLLQDVYLQLYFMDKSEEKHAQYKSAKAQFKNMQYLLSVTSVMDNLKVPLIAFFQFKGFPGRARIRIKQNTYFQMMEFKSQIDRQQFQELSRISFETLLNEQKCRILSYVSKARPGLKFYFIESLTQLLPLDKHFTNSPYKLLRPELIQDDQLDGIVFRDKRKSFDTQKVIQIIDDKENELLKILQNQEQYFSNSKELASLLHDSGLNIRRLGSVYQKSRLLWLKKILRAELLARCLKNFYRSDFQSNIRVQSERVTTKQRQQQIEQRRVISFLNVIFGVSEGTKELWKKLNIYCKRQFGCLAYVNNYTDINIPYFLQAIQSHLKIMLSDKILQRQFFRSNSSLQPSDFIRFQFTSTTYNLDFTEQFQEIYMCLAQHSQHSYDRLMEFLAQKSEKMNMSYFQILKNHEIYDRICSFMLVFRTPQQMQRFNKIKVNSLPSKYLIERKISEIKWFLKWENIQQLHSCYISLQTYLKRWLVDLHPLIVHVNRLIAQFLVAHPIYYEESLKYAQNTLGMHLKIFGKDYEKATWQILWKDYLLLGNAYLVCKNTQQAIKNLLAAKELVKADQLMQFQDYGKLFLKLCIAKLDSKDYEQGYKIGLHFYSFAKDQDDQKLQGYLIKVAYYMLRLLQLSLNNDRFFQFLQTFSRHVQLMYQQYPDLLIQALIVSAMYPLDLVVINRSKNKLRFQMMMEELRRINSELFPNLGHYISDNLSDGKFPASFVSQLKIADKLMDQIVDEQLLDEWQQICQNQNQEDFDKEINKNISDGLSFLVNITSILSLVEPDYLSIIQEQ